MDETIGCALIVLIAGLAACASGLTDRTVNLQYAPDPGIERLTGAQALTVFRFADRRGDERDGDLLRVGGFYDTWGNRVAKIFATTQWPEALVQDLTATFTLRGVETVATADHEYVPGTSPVSTPLALGGEIRNFSIESGRTIQAHVSGIIRLYNQQGTLLLEKRIAARSPRDTHESEYLRELSQRSGRRICPKRRERSGPHTPARRGALRTNSQVAA